MSRLSTTKLEALRAVAAGRVEYGVLYPKMARRRPHQALVGVMIDGHEVYGAAHRTYQALLEAELIRERLEDVETRTVPPEKRTRTSVAGFTEVTELPERQVPIDPGWRVRVELTTTGQEAVERLTGA